MTEIEKILYWKQFRQAIEAERVRAREVAQLAYRRLELGEGQPMFTSRLPKNYNINELMEKLR